MLAIWSRSDTFAHAFLVPPISLWLAWRRRAVLARLPQQPMPWLLLPMAGACLLWLVGEMATVNAASQFALVTLVVLSVPALFGWAITRELLFPLAFLYFAVPLGEFLVPTLIDHTADFTVAALRLSGVPVYREGNEFVIPSGNWSVVEACSGVRYLIASLMVGTLFAYLNYASLIRRLLFVAVAIVVPIVANWLRAYMIVMIGHLSGNKLAVGVDHLIYGWVFFGVVIGIMFLIGARWAETEPHAIVPDGLHEPYPLQTGRTWFMSGAVVLLLLITQGLQSRLDQVTSDRPVALRLPESTAMQPMPFEPGFRNPLARAGADYVQDGESVWLWVGYFRQQRSDRKLVSSTNTLVADTDKRWVQVARGTRKVALPGGPVVVRTAELRQGTPLHGAPAERLLAWQLYWVGDRLVSSDAWAKMFQAYDRMRGRGDDGAALILVTPLTADADATLEAFLQSRAVEITSMLAAAGGSR